VRELHYDTLHKMWPMLRTAEPSLYGVTNAEQMEGEKKNSKKACKVNIRKLCQQNQWNTREIIKMFE